LTNSVTSPQRTAAALTDAGSVTSSLNWQDAWQVDTIWVSYASVDLFRITPEQLSGKSQAETAIGPSDEGNRNLEFS
jgi:hypothetical protein